MESIGQILADYDLAKKKYITREFQDYGYRLALELDDERHKSLYIKLAKEEPRKLLEEARTFIKDAQKVRNKAKLFMWKLKKLKEKKNLKWFLKVVYNNLTSLFRFFKMNDMTAAGNKKGFKSFFIQFTGNFFN